MTTVTWTPIDTLPLPDGSINVPWLRLVASLRGATHLCFEATGEWIAIPGLLAPCGPDGLSGLALPADRVVIADAPPGALIGRIGGSSASLKAEGAFVIGSSAVVSVPAGSIGPLFVSFNIVGRPVAVTSITVKVSGATPSL
jgi:hypothetical protein